MTDRGPVQHVLIVGGGSAGWLTAGRLAADHYASREDGLKVTLIESPDVATIGVGEGTWPTMRETLRKIGISESDFIRECDASFKQGTSFHGWRNGQADDQYYHPFSLPAEEGRLALEAYWQGQGGSYGTAVSPQIALCDAGLAPKQTSTPDYAAVVNYGYHLDAGKFATLLQNHATTQLGVRHIRDHVTGVAAADNGYISALETKNHGRLEADLYIDCSGSAGLLIEGHFGIAQKDCGDILKNNTALAAQIPYSSPIDAIASTTLSTAQSAGWIWDIGLYSRRGTGYVYAADYMDDDCAEITLRHYLAKTIGTKKAGDASIRKLSFQPGYREKFRVGNCVAVGMSAGFLEPLEASALVMVELSATQISEGLPTDKAAMPAVADRFNRRFSDRWERIIDFLKLHYVLSERTDSAYWQDMRSDHMPDRLRALLELWQFDAPSRFDFTGTEEVFPAASYKYVLYGMGQRPPVITHTGRHYDTDRIDQAFAAVAQDRAKFLNGLPTNRALLQTIRTRHSEKRSALSR